MNMHHSQTESPVSTVMLRFSMFISCPNPAVSHSPCAWRFLPCIYLQANMYLHHARQIILTVRMFSPEGVHYDSVK